MILVFVSLVVVNYQGVWLLCDRSLKMGITKSRMKYVSSSVHLWIATAGLHFLYAWVLHFSHTAPRLTFFLKLLHGFQLVSSQQPATSWWFFQVAGLSYFIMSRATLILLLFGSGLWDASFCGYVSIVLFCASLQSFCPKVNLQVCSSQRLTRSAPLAAEDNF